jgi:mannosylglycoprotein endo-beta-mannosidase
MQFLHFAALVLNKSVPSNDPIDILNIKLKHFKKYSKGWGSNLYGHNKKQKRDKKEELASIEALEEESDLSPELNSRKTDIHVQLFNLFAEEELMWYHRSHEKWLLEGDLNTNYFHRVANGRKRKNTMFSLKENDILIEGTNNLISHATTYYKNLFGPAVGNILEFDANMWKPHEKLSEEET